MPKTATRIVRLVPQSVSPNTARRPSISLRPLKRITAAPSPNPDDPIEPLLEVKRAAYLLGISVKTLRDWILYRRIDIVKVGAHVRIRPETIRSLVARNTRPAESSHAHLEAPR